MPKYLLLKHYRGGPEPHHPFPPMDQWAPEDVEAHFAFLKQVGEVLQASGESETTYSTRRKQLGVLRHETGLSRRLLRARAARRLHAENGLVELAVEGIVVADDGEVVELCEHLGVLPFRPPPL